MIHKHIVVIFRMGYSRFDIILAYRSVRDIEVTI
jgi:hypothetical protein